MQLSAGYNLVFDTYEGDGDYRDSDIIVLRTMEDVKDALKILNRFHSTNSHHNNPGLGNVDCDEIKAHRIYPILIEELKSNKWFLDVCEEYEISPKDDDSLFDVVIEIFNLYSRGCYGYDYLRVFNSFKVFYLSEVVDLTKDFE